MLYTISDNIYVLSGLPGLFIRKHDLLVIADIHLGFESSVAYEGIFVPRVQLKKILELIDKMVNVVYPRRVVINGDLKHHFGGLLKQEREEITKLIEHLWSKGIKEITVIRGNHDNYVSLVLEDLGVGFIDKLVLNSIMLVHGHELFDPAKYSVKIIIIGHEHPSVALRDELGVTYKFPCFLKGKLVTNQELLVLAPLSIYASGNTVSLERENYLSPLVKKYGLIDYFKPYMIDEELGILELPTLKDLPMAEIF